MHEGPLVIMVSYMGRGFKQFCKYTNGVPEMRLGLERRNAICLRATSETLHWNHKIKTWNTTCEHQLRIISIIFIIEASPLPISFSVYFVSFAVGRENRGHGGLSLYICLFRVFIFLYRCFQVINNQSESSASSCWYDLYVISWVYITAH